MKSIILASALVITASAFAASKTYQVTGPVVEMTESNFTVDKGGEKWEIQKDAAMKINGGELQKGAKVTVKYHMVADQVEVKADKKAEKKK